MRRWLSMWAQNTCTSKSRKDRSRGSWISKLCCEPSSWFSFGDFHALPLKKGNGMGWKSEPRMKGRSIMQIHIPLPENLIMWPGQRACSEADPNILNGNRPFAKIFQKLFPWVRTVKPWNTDHSKHKHLLCVRFWKYRDDMYKVLCSEPGP